MYSTDNKIKKQFDPLNEWKTSKKNVYGMIIIGIIMMIIVSSILSYGFFIKGVGAIAGKVGRKGAEVEEDPIAAYGYFIISMILFNLVGIMFIIGGIIWKNRLSKRYNIEKSLMMGNTFDMIGEKFFDLWINVFTQSSLVFESNREKRVILIPKKNIRITYFFGDENRFDPNVKYYCTVEIKPITHKGIFGKTTKYVKESDLIETVKIIEQIFDHKIIKNFFLQHQSPKQL